MYEARGKRTLDIILAIGMLCVTALPMCVVAAAIRVAMGSPVLFKQRRSGRYSQPFVLIKFRTMEPADQNSASASADRITPLGRVLRGTSLDELPQLVNVLRGEMSLVGPRPLLPEYDALYSIAQRQRLEVRPGLTGLAQVCGRSRLSWTEKFSLDIAYVEQVTLNRDLRILASTICQLVNPKTATPADRQIEERFNGTN